MQGLGGPGEGAGLEASSRAVEEAGEAVDRFDFRAAERAAGRASVAFSEAGRGHLAHDWRRCAWRLRRLADQQEARGIRPDGPAPGGGDQ